MPLPAGGRADLLHPLGLRGPSVALWFRHPRAQRNSKTGTGQARISAVVVEPMMKLRSGEWP
jgi:hypothetical protein